MIFIKQKVLVLTVAVLACMSAEFASAQRVYSVVFSQLPKDFQLYARNDSNLAEVPVAGVIEVAGWDHMSVVTYRNKKRVGYTRSALNYDGKTTAEFEMKPQIKAEMADYSIEVYACQEADSSLLIRRDEIVAGDFYVISGQSNAAAIQFGVWSNKYARTLARTPDNDPTVGLGDTLWIPSSWSWPYAGAWGVEMQKYILENHGIPTCVINGALPGSYISYHVNRNEQNPASATLYGLLYNRIKVANPTRIRAFFWYQGEQEAIENIKGYNVQYDKLFKYWQADYPQVEQYVVVQIPVLFNPFYEAGAIREFQRRTKYLYPKTEHFTALGLPGFDGIHYDLKGYQELGRRFYNFLDPMIYGAPADVAMSCPDIQKVYYATEKKDEIVMQFDPGQRLKWPADTVMDDYKGNKFTKSIREVFFFDSDETKPAGVQSGSADGNIVRLKLAAAAVAQKLNYLPAFKEERVSAYQGPFLKNSQGLSAFSFQEHAIADAIVFSPFDVTESVFATVKLTWNAPGADSIVLERKAEGEADYSVVEDYDGKASSYEDKAVAPSTTYSYRIQGFSAVSQSAVLTKSLKMSPLLATEIPNQEKYWEVYPNPAPDQLEVEFRTPASGELQIFNLNGQSLLTQKVVSSTYQQLQVGFLDTGLYIVSFKRTDGSVISRQILKK